MSVLLQVVCIAHSPVCSTLRIALRKIVSWGEEAEVFMVSEGDREIGVKSSHSLGEKAVEQFDRASFDTPVPSGQQHCSSRTRQWCRWSAHSQWCPCRKWLGWVEGDLLFFSRLRKCRRCCAFLESVMVLVVQVRSSVMCTPRNLVLPTLSTVEPLMVSGGLASQPLLSSPHWGTGCWHHTIQPAVPLLLCSYLNSLCFVYM